MLPSLSQAGRQDLGALRRAFLQFQMQSDLFLFAAAGFLFVAGPSIVRLLYDPRYASVGTMLSVLASGLIGLRYAVVEQYCMMQGQVRVLAGWNALRAVTLALSLPAGFTLFGLPGATRRGDYDPVCCLAARHPVQGAPWAAGLALRTRRHSCPAAGAGAGRGGQLDV